MVIVINDPLMCQAASRRLHHRDAHSLEICWRTAVEDVTHVQELVRYFHSDSGYSCGGTVPLEGSVRDGNDDGNAAA